MDGRSVLGSGRPWKRITTATKRGDCWNFGVPEGEGHRAPEVDCGRHEEHGHLNGAMQSPGRAHRCPVCPADGRERIPGGGLSGARVEGYLGSLGKFEDDPEATEFIRELANAEPKGLGEGRLGALG